MIHDRIVFRSADPDQSAAASGPSRRKFLQAGAAAGGGLMLSLRLPFGPGEVRAADTQTFAPNAFIRIGSDGRSFSSCPMSRWAKEPTPRSRC